MTARHWILAAALVGLAGAVPARAEVRQVVDDTDREVRLAEPAERIVSLAPNVTELLFTAGAGERIVATVEYSDFPEAAERIPRIGRHDQLNLEAILELQPDLVVGWQSGNPGRQIDRLRELGVPVYLSEPRQPRDVADTVSRLGHLAGTEAVAEEAAAAFIERFETLRGLYAGRETVEVFYQVWDDPLMTVNGDHMISAIIRGCGGRNVFADLPSLAPRVDVEAVLDRDPALIVAGSRGRERVGWLDDWRAWPELEAVERDQLQFIPSALLQRQTARILDGMERLCQQIEQARRR